MLDSALPLSTPYDPAEDPPGSIDPLGTVPTAEQLADVLLPGLTARMWRARHLTFAALAAHIGERAAADAGDEELRLETRLGFERLFVSAIALQDSKQDGWRPAANRLPGIGLARRSILAGHQTLGKQNFLKGQAINGPFGVVQRLARDLDIVDADNRLSRNGQELLMVWSAEQELAGILDEAGSKSAGATWLGQVIRRVLSHVNNAEWPRPQWRGWRDWADRLRPDKPSTREKSVLFRLLSSKVNPTRSRCIELLRKADIRRTFKEASDRTRGYQDRVILAQ